MPCRCDYMEPNKREVELSRVACLLDELKGEPIRKPFWEGMHPSVYNKGLGQKDADEMVEEICTKLRQVDVTKYSLEMQIWWRDHQAADKIRLETEA